MKKLRATLLRLKGLFLRDARERELAEEIESHLQLHIDDNLRAGMTPEQARRVAILKLGGVDSTKEAYRDRSTIPLLENTFQDLRFTIRQLRRNPGFTMTAILMVTLGIGASVAIFGFADAALIKPLPYQSPTRLAHVTESFAEVPRANLSYPDYLDWKRLNTVFSSLDVYGMRGLVLKAPAGAESLRGTRVSDGFFRTLGVIPVLGRDFYTGEDLPGAPPTVMLSFASWQKRFGGRQDIIGQQLTLNDISHTIVGVLPESFQFAPTGSSEFWVTLHPAGGCDLRRSCHSLEGIGRLKDGATVATALSEMTLIAKDLERQYPDSNRGQGASVVALSEVIVGDIRPVLLVLLGGAGLLLLIACVNVASLLLVRFETRKRELAVRRALGASTARLIRQFVTEGLVVVAAGSILGLVAAQWAMRVLLRLIPTDMMANMPFLDGLTLNSRVVAFAAAVSLVAAVLFSITPTLRLSSLEIREGMAEGNRGAGNTWRRMGSKLVVLELATAMVLLVGAGLLGKSFYRLLQVEPGFQPDHLITLAISSPRTSYGNDQQAVALGRRVVDHLKSLPGVTSVALTTTLPVTFNGNTDWIRFVGRPYNGQHNEVNQRQVTSDYFTTLRARLLRGRAFADAEDGGKPQVVVINQTLARKYFPGEDPIGKQIGDTELTSGSIKEIIGVVDDIREGALDSDIWPAVYYAFNQQPDNDFSVVIRTAQAEQSALPVLRSAIKEIDLNISVSKETTMTERVNNSPTVYLHRSSAWLVGGFAAMALLLGVVGLYGVIAYSVSQRTREIGVRIALGAQRRSVYQLILREAGALAVAGIGIGLACSVAAASLMRKLLFGTPPWDITTLIAVAGVLGVAALLASFLPARRAASVNPIEALRAE
jgi:predicted permease